MNSGIEILDLADGTVWKLPRRDLGSLRRFAWIGVVVGAVMLGFMALWMSGPLRMAFGNHGMFLWFNLLLASSGFIGVFIALRILLVSYAVLRQRTWAEIRLIEGEFIVTEHLLGWHPKRRFEAELTEKFMLSNDLTSWKASASVEAPDQVPVQEMPKTFQVPEHLRFCLQARSKVKDFLITAVYPRDILLRLGQDLAEKVPQSSFDLNSSPAAIPLEEEHVEDFTPSPVESTLPEMPAWTRVTMKEISNGCAFAVPPLGVFKGSHGLFGLGLAFFIFSGVFLFMILFTNGEKQPVWIPALMISPFLLLAITMLRSGLQMGQTQVLIAVQDGKLRLQKSSPFGSREQSWAAGDLKSIQSVPTGTTVNGRRLYRMEIQPRSGKAVKLLGQLSPEEQSWMAGHLQRHIFQAGLNIPGTQSLI